MPKLQQNFIMVDSAERLEQMMLSGFYCTMIKLEDSSTMAQQPIGHNCPMDPIPGHRNDDGGKGNESPHHLVRCRRVGPVIYLYLDSIYRALVTPFMSINGSKTEKCIEYMPHEIKAQ